MITDVGREPERFVSSSRAAIREEVVDEHNPMPDEAVIANGDQFANKCVRLDAGVGTNCYAPLHFNEWADETVIPNFASVKIDRLNQRHFFTKDDVDDSTLQDSWFTHKIISLIQDGIHWDENEEPLRAAFR